MGSFRLVVASLVALQNAANGVSSHATPDWAAAVGCHSSAAPHMYNDLQSVIKGTAGVNIEAGCTAGEQAYLVTHISYACSSLSS